MTSLKINLGIGRTDKKCGHGSLASAPCMRPALAHDIELVRIRAGRGAFLTAEALEGMSGCPGSKPEASQGRRARQALGGPSAALPKQRRRRSYCRGPLSMAGSAASRRGGPALFSVVRGRCRDQFKSDRSWPIPSISSSLQLPGKPGAKRAPHDQLFVLRGQPG
jgi:hypothetical protein